MTSFAELGLAEPILKALEAEGYTTPTPIQAKAIRPIMESRDILGIAQTGTGKTAAFALPILHRLAADRRPAPRKGCRALILSPTRELASQIAESFRNYGRHLGLTVAVVFGGVAPRPQIQALARGIDILVAAPGRLLDHIGERHADISGTEIFVLDEADQMLDLGFVKPIRRIVGCMSQRRQNLFFSATMPNEISGLADELLKDPIKVSVAPVSTTAERVSQRVILIEAPKKRAILTELLANPDMKRTLVFTRTKRGADRVARHLEANGTNAAAIHGNKSQRQRENTLEDFRQGRVAVLVATDIAARGIDIDLVSHVVNYELPEVPEAYVHRIGRTARAGASGHAISLCAPEERDQLRAIERLTRQQIPHEDRRNDPNVIAPPRAEGSDRDDRDNDRRGNAGRRDQQRGGGGERSRQERPRFGGGRSEGDRAQNGGRGSDRAGGRGPRPNGDQQVTQAGAAAFDRSSETRRPDSRGQENRAPRGDSDARPPRREFSDRGPRDEHRGPRAEHRGPRDDGDRRPHRDSDSRPRPARSEGSEPRGNRDEGNLSSVGFLKRPRPAGARTAEGRPSHGKSHGPGGNRDSRPPNTGGRNAERGDRRGEDRPRSASRTDRRGANS